jgi:hypothetical protein
MLGAIAALLVGVLALVHAQTSTTSSNSQLELQLANDGNAAITAGQKANTDADSLLGCKLNYLQSQVSGQTPTPCVPPAVPDQTQINNDNLAVAAAGATVFTDLMNLEQAQDGEIQSLQTLTQSQNSTMTALQTQMQNQGTALSALQTQSQSQASAIGSLQNAVSGLQQQLAKMQQDMAYVCSRRGNVCP